jgi:hypothetical protein
VFFDTFQPASAYQYPSSSYTGSYATPSNNSYASTPTPSYASATASYASATASYASATASYGLTITGYGPSSSLTGYGSTSNSGFTLPNPGYGTTDTGYASAPSATGGYAVYASMSHDGSYGALPPISQLPAVFPRTIRSVDAVNAQEECKSTLWGGTCALNGQTDCLDTSSKLSRYVWID